MLYGPYFPFNRHSGNILKRFCVRYVLSKPKPLHAKYADWNFRAKLEENTMFDLCLECSVYWLRFCVAILWKNDLTINELKNSSRSDQVLMSAQKSQGSCECLVTPGISPFLQKMTLPEVPGMQEHKFCRAHSETQRNAVRAKSECRAQADGETFLDGSFQEWKAIYDS